MKELDDNALEVVRRDIDKRLKRKWYIIQIKIIYILL